MPIAARQRTKTSQDGLVTRIYLFGIGYVGLALALYFVAKLPLHAVPLLLLFMGTASVLQLITVALFGPVMFSLTFPFSFFTLLLMGPGASALVACASIVTGAFYPVRRPWLNTIYYCGAASFGAIAAYAVYTATGGQMPPGSLWGNLVPTMAAAVVFFATNRLLSVGVTLTSNRTSLQVGLSDSLWLLLGYMPSAFVALAGAEDLAEDGGRVLVLLFPALTLPWAASMLVIQQRRELAQRRRQLQHLGVVHRLGVKFNSTATCDEVLKEVESLVFSLAPVRQVGIFLRHSEGIERLLYFSPGDPQHMVETIPGLEATQEDIDGLSPGGPPLVKTVEVPWPEDAQGGRPQMNVASVHYYALSVRGKVTGAMALWFMGEPTLSEGVGEIFATVAETVASAVDRQRQSEKAESAWKRTLEAQEETRREVAATLHGLVQTRLVVLWHRLGQFKTQVQEPRQQAAIENLCGELLNLQEQVRSLSAHLYPSIVKVGLVPALRSLVSRAGTTASIDLVVDPKIEEMDVDGEAISERVRLAMYRITEQALGNIVKHSDASKVTIRVSNSASSVSMAIEDNGRGFVAGKTPFGMGIHLMREYAVAAGGNLAISSAPTKGCTIQVTVPLRGPVEPSLPTQVGDIVVPVRADQSSNSFRSLVGRS